MSSLRELGLIMNDLSGILPEELAGLANLRRLRLAGNSLAGCLPLTLTQISNSDLPDTGLPFCE